MTTERLEKLRLFVGWMDGWMDGWRDGWVDRRICIQDFFKFPVNKSIE